MTDVFVDARFEIGVAQAAITTLAVMLTIGIAFLIRPSAATLYWTFAFTLAMIATCGVMAGEVTGDDVIRRVSLGALMGAPALLWSGFRALWGLRPHLWTGAALAVASAAALAAVGDSGWFPTVYRTVFLAASVFALLFFIDWVRAADRRADRLVLPLAVVSAAFFVLGLGAFVAGAAMPAPGGDEFAVLRIIASIGMLAYVACAIVAVVGIATRDGGLVRSAAALTAWQMFERTATDRLRRAQQASEAWSVVYLRLDDAVDIRQTAGATALASLSTRFEEEVRTVFPAECDIGSPGPGDVVVLVPRSDAAVRDLLRAMLQRIPALDVHSSLPIRPTASAGWASASVLGYDLDALVDMAREAAVLSAERGGDRWERVGATVVERLIGESALP